jgi:hypothetical protein
MFELSARNARANRAAGREPVCRECRNPPKPPDPATMEKMRRWWLEDSGLSLEEVQELARLVWSPLPA